MISAQVIADSLSPDDVRLTTMQLRYPRFVHAELMTHRVFSRNASSSRAIPVKRLIEDLRRDPAMPVFWGSNQAGMQAGAELTGSDLECAQAEWLAAMDNAISHAEHLMHYGLHKQIANRVLEPWAHINVVVTATEWNNFWELRCHPDAQPEMRALAEAMNVAQGTSAPKLLQPGEWHLPYVSLADSQECLERARRSTYRTSNMNTDQLLTRMQIKLSVARCARVSYLTYAGDKPDIEDDFKLYDRLVGSRPLHASPAEHQATPDLMLDPAMTGTWEHPEEHGNFTGWRQFRKQLEKEAWA